MHFCKSYIRKCLKYHSLVYLQLTHSTFLLISVATVNECIVYELYTAQSRESLNFVCCPLILFPFFSFSQQEFTVYCVQTMQLGGELWLIIIFSFWSLYSCSFHFVRSTYQAGSHTACGRLQPLHTAAGTTGREKTEASVGWAGVEEPELLYSPKCRCCKHLTKCIIKMYIVFNLK